jgi:RNA polymerase sigma-70 factor (ECF subfamily)
MTDVIPQLRAFARNLSGNPDKADDLVQDTMVKMWAARARFEAGTHFKAWAFTILRNHFFSISRRNRFVGEWDDQVADRILAAPASQDMAVQFSDLLRALQQLPVPQREALILVGAGDLSYEEVASITGSAVGTVKSRVSRARNALQALMESGLLSIKRSETSCVAEPIVSFMAYVETIKARNVADRQIESLAA